MVSVIHQDGKITKSFHLPNLSEYSTGNSVSVDFDINLDDLISEWKLSICPRHLSSNSNQDSLVNCDILITLMCKSANTPIKSFDDVIINSYVKGRENYPNVIKQKSHNEWKSILIPRATLSTLSDLDKENALEFTLEFVISNSILNMAVNSLKTLSLDSKCMLKNSSTYDTCLVTTAGSKFYVHSAVLEARSNLFVSNNTSNEDCSELTEHKLSRTNTPSKTDITPNDSEMSTMLFGGSPMRRRTPLFMVSLDSTAPKSVTKKTPVKTPQKKILKMDHSQTQLTNFFPRTSTLNNGDENSSSSAKKSINFSPIVNSPRKMHESPFKESPRNKITSYMSPRGQSILSPCGTKPLTNFQSPKRKLSFDDFSQDSKEQLKVINLNMSTSIAQEMLLWIYTGNVV